MTRESVIEGYLINSPKVLAEMLYDTITRYEARIAELEAPKSCEGCKYEMPTEMYIFDNYCSCCLRDKGDYYEQKDNR